MLCLTMKGRANADLEGGKAMRRMADEIVESAKEMGAQLYAVTGVHSGSLRFDPTTFGSLRPKVRHMKQGTHLNTSTEMVKNRQCPAGNPGYPHRKAVWLFCETNPNEKS